MGIKHKLSKLPNEKGYATEWNDDHKIDSDIDFASHSGVNVGEPINPSDIATKNYVDSGGVGGIPADYLLYSTTGETFLNNLWNDVTGASIIITTGINDVVLISYAAEINTPYFASTSSLRITKNGVELSGSSYSLGNGHNGNVNMGACTIKDKPGSGSQTYKLQYKSNDTTNRKGTIRLWQLTILHFK